MIVFLIPKFRVWPDLLIKCLLWSFLLVLMCWFALTEPTFIIHILRNYSVAVSIPGTIPRIPRDIAGNTFSTRQDTVYGTAHSPNTPWKRLQTGVFSIVWTKTWDLQLSQLETTLIENLVHHYWSSTVNSTGNNFKITFLHTMPLSSFHFKICTQVHTNN